MPTFEIGDVTFRAKSNDQINWQVVDKNGNNVTLPAGIIVELRTLQLGEDDSTAIKFKTNDSSPQISYTTAGIITFTPDIINFASQAVYKFFFNFIDGAGNHYIPEGKNLSMKILEDFL